MLTHKNILLTDQIMQVEGNIVSDMGGEKVMLSIQNGKYYNLGENGGLIWELLESPVEVNEVINKLLHVYEVDQSECQEEVKTFLSQLINEGLVKIL